MSIIRLAGNRFVGLSTDVKPTVNIDAGALFTESDTGAITVWGGSVWLEIPLDHVNILPGNIHVPYDFVYTSAATRIAATYAAADVGKFIRQTDTDDIYMVISNSPNTFVKVSGSGTGEPNTASNVGTGGIGVFKQKTGVDLEFKNVIAGNGITATDDVTDNEIEIGVKSDVTTGEDIAPVNLSSNGTGLDVNQLNGDHLNIDWIPIHYTRNSSIAEADSVIDLSAHLSGIDNKIGSIDLLDIGNKSAVKLATLAALPANTSIGSGVGKILLADANGVLVIDNLNVQTNNRVLIRNEVIGSNNGIYDVIYAGDATNPFQLRRSVDFDENIDIKAGALIVSTNGAVNSDILWILTTNNPIVIDSTSLTFADINNSGSTEDGYQNVFMGKTGLGSETPTYTEGQGSGLASGTNLEQAINTVDTYIGVQPTANTRTNNPIVAGNDVNANIEELDDTVGSDSDISSIIHITVDSTLMKKASDLDAALNSHETNTSNPHSTTLDKAAAAGASTDEDIIITSGGSITINTGADLVITDTPLDPTDAANKAYVDLTTSGLKTKGSARAATTIALADAYTYDNGTLGVGATLTKTTNGAFPAQDGITLVQDETVLIKNETAGNAPYNGIYKLTVVGDGSNPWELTRVINNDEASEFTSAYVFIEEGTAQADNGWQCTTDNPVVVGTTNITWAQFSAAGQITAGAGLSKSGNTLNIGDAGKGVQVNANDIEFSASEVLEAGTGLKVGTASYQLNVEPNDFAGTGLEDDGSDNLRVKADVTGGSNLSKSVNVSSNGLAVKVDDSTIAEGASSRLIVKSAGITATQLNASVAGNGISGGAGTALALDINGIAAAETTPDNADLIAIYDNSTTTLKKMTRANFLPKYDHKQPTNIYKPAVNHNVDINFPESVDNVPCMRVVGNEDEGSNGGAEYFFVSDGRTPTKVSFRYKVGATGGTIELDIFDTAGSSDAYATGLNSTSMTTATITSGINGTYTAESIFRVRAVAILDKDDIAYLGDVIITY